MHGTKTVQRLILIRAANEFGHCRRARCRCLRLRWRVTIARERELKHYSARASETKRQRCCCFTPLRCCTAHPAAVVWLDWLRVACSVLRLRHEREKRTTYECTKCVRVTVRLCVCVSLRCLAFLGWLFERRVCESTLACVRACAECMRVWVLFLIEFDCQMRD